VQSAAPPADAEPAAQTEHTTSDVAEPAVEGPDPAAHCVHGAQAPAPDDDQVPAEQGVHVCAPSGAAEPAAQTAQVVLAVSEHGAVCAEPRGQVEQAVQGAAPVGLNVEPCTHEKMHWLSAELHVAVAEHVHCARPVAVVALYSPAKGHCVQAVAPAVEEKVFAAQRTQAPVGVADELPGWHAVHCTSAVAAQAVVTDLPEAQAEQVAHGSTPEALQVEPATQGPACTHAPNAAAQ